MQIKTNKLTHIFEKGGINEFVAIDDIDLTFEQGEFITIIGETGSGKTTFIEHLNALVKPTSGTVEIIDQELAHALKSNAKAIKKNKDVSEIAFTITNSRRKIKEVKKLRKRIGIVFQFAEYQLFEETIEKDIIFGPVTMGVPKEQAIKEAKHYIELVGMEQSFLTRSPFMLSGGQKRRVALAGILSMDPDFLVFDEPTAGLDPEGEKEMYKIFRKLNKKGKTIIVVTHNMDHVLENSNRTIVFKEGKILRDGNSLDIMYDKEFLEGNSLEVPKVVDFAHELKKKDFDIPKVRTIEELSEEISKKL